MEYREIVAVTGLGGLFQLLATKSDGAIVRNLADKTTKFISARQHNVTPLESIEVYTTGDNVRLQHVFKKMEEHETKTPPAGVKTDNNSIKTYFKSILPEFDEERVYASDMKKMLKWYEILKGADLLKFEEETEETDGAAAETDASDATEEKPKKAKAKKSVDADTEATDADGEEKPKKVAKKKKAEPTPEGEEAPAKKVAKKKKTEE